MHRSAPVVVLVVHGPNADVLGSDRTAVNTVRRLGCGVVTGAVDLALIVGIEKEAQAVAVQIAAACTATTGVT